MPAREPYSNCKYKQRVRFKRSPLKLDQQDILESPLVCHARP